MLARAGLWTTIEEELNLNEDFTINFFSKKDIKCHVFGAFESKNNKVRNCWNNVLKIFLKGFLATIKIICGTT